MKRKKVLVTGSSGFIGQRLVEALLLQGHRVMGIDVKKTQQSSKGVFRFTKGTIHAGKLKKTGFVPDWIFHCAGGGTVGFAELFPLEDFRMNVESCLELLSFARHIEPKPRIVFMSSAAVYGNRRAKELSEKTLSKPVSNYGFHKQMAESIFRFYSLRWGVPSVLVRIFSVYGNGLRKQLFWDAAKKMKTGNTVFAGSGQEVRDFVHVDDLCRFLLTIISRSKPQAPIYNCGLGRVVRIKKALEMLAGCLGAAKPIFDGKVRHGDPKRLVANPGRALRAGWRPRIDFSEGIRLYAEWVKNNEKK